MYIYRQALSWALGMGSDCAFFVSADSLHPSQHEGIKPKTNVEMCTTDKNKYAASIEWWHVRRRQRNTRNTLHEGNDDNDESEERKQSFLGFDPRRCVCVCLCLCNMGEEHEVVMLINLTCCYVPFLIAHTRDSVYAYQHERTAQPRL